MDIACLNVVQDVGAQDASQCSKTFAPFRRVFQNGC